jgi:hypothetical protein
MNSMDGKCVFPALLDYLLNDAPDDQIAFPEVTESINTFP